MRFRKFIPFYKIDEAKREVYGIVTAQLPDQADETCHYESTVPYYKAVAEEMGKATDGENIMPLREMHQLSAVGKGTQLAPHDDTKEILMAFKVVDDNAWKKVVERVYTGFSQGGDYIRKWVENGINYYTAKPAEVSLVDNPCLGAARFVIKADGTMALQKMLAGGQVVDTPVANDAEAGEMGEMVKLLNRMAAKSAKCPCKCEMCAKGECKGCKAETKCASCGCGTKANEAGELEKAIERVLVRFGVVKEAKTKRVAGVDLPASCFAYVGDPEKTGTWKLPINFPGDDEKTKTHIRNALSRFSSTQGIPDDEKDKVKAKIVAAAKKHGIETSDASDKAIRGTLAKMLPAYLVADPAKTKLAGKQVSELVKGMYQVSSLAMMLQDLQWLVASTEYERDWEQDGSTVPDELRTSFEAMIPIFIAMAREEATELTQPQKGLGGSMKKLFANLVAILSKLAPEELKKASLEPVTAADVQKAFDEFEKGSKTCHECMDEMHKAVTEHNDKMANLATEHADKCVKLHKAHMESMHGSIEKIRKAMGATDATSQQPTGGTMTDGEKKAKEAADLAKAEADRLAAEAVIKAARDAGNEALAKTLETMQKTMDEQAKAAKAVSEELVKAQATIKEYGDKLEKHGPAAPGSLFLAARNRQPLPATGTDDGTGL